MEAIFSSETLVDFQRTTRRYIPEDSVLHNYRCEDFKSYKSQEFPSPCLWGLYYKQYIRAWAGFNPKTQMLVSSKTRTDQSHSSKIFEVMMRVEVPQRGLQNAYK
jgi:hypothetical protein